MRKRSMLSLIALIITGSSVAQNTETNRPHLVVNIVVSGMRSTDLERYQANFGEGGLKTLYNEGLRFSDCHYSYQQTLTPVSLATLSTGAQPSTHGVVGYGWYDYVVNKWVDLILDDRTTNIKYPNDEGGYSPRHLVAPTVSDALVLDSPKSQAVTIALDPASAIILSGKSGSPFWFDARSCDWSSSTAYLEEMPQWAVLYNDSEKDIIRTSDRWHRELSPLLYVNSKYTDQEIEKILGEMIAVSNRASRADRYVRYHKIITQTPIGNDIVANFAKMSIDNLALGTDEDVDILNICFDASRNIVEQYGPESIEAEDMYYKLDLAISDLMSHISTQLPDKRVVYCLTSDRGTSPSYEVNGDGVNHFNALQFEVILNGFLSARFGSGDWVLSCDNRCVYLNHNTIYENGLSLSQIQEETATFALQLRGVSQAITATALRSSYFGSGYANLIQNGFYPRRSGDVILNLMPNWIEKDDNRRSMSGSMYNYDRHIPFVLYGSGIPTAVESRSIDAISIAPTLSAIMGVEEPAASEGKPLEELRNIY